MGDLLISLGLHDFSEREIDGIDHTIGLEDEEGNLVGTGSVAGNVLKYIGGEKTMMQSKVHTF